jgi:hypothetical protein
VRNTRSRLPGQSEVYLTIKARPASWEPSF